MQKTKNHYYSHRNHIGQFAINNHLSTSLNERRAKLALTFFLLSAILSAAYEATTTILIK